MDHQFGHLQRVGSSVELCPPLEATVTGDIAGDVATPSKRCIGYKVQSPEEKTNLSWNSIALGATLQHPVRLMPQRVSVEGTRRERKKRKEAPRGRAVYHLPHVRLAQVHTA